MAKPLAHPYPGQFLTEENSIGIKDPVRHDDLTGDIRLNCEVTGCQLASDASVFTMLYAPPGTGTLDTCSLLTRSATSNTLPLAAAATGSEICVRHPSGDIALLVIQTKSTPRLKDLSFVTADMTVWPAS